MYLTKRQQQLAGRPGAALQVGTLAHALYEVAGAPNWLEESTRIMLEAAAQLEPKEFDKLLRIHDALPKLKLPWTRGPREISLRMPLLDCPGAFIVGRLDGTCNTPSGQLWSEQLKTIDMSHDAATTIDKVRRSYHEITYNVLWHSNFLERELSGIALVLARKRPTKADPMVFSTDLIELPRLEAAELFIPIEKAFQALHHWTIEATAPILKNYSSCHTPFGTCAFKPHCHYGVRVDALDLVPAPTRYTAKDFLS